jgi:transposase
MSLLYNDNEVVKLPKYVSKEKREDIIFHSKNGESNAVIAKFLRISVRTVERILKAFSEETAFDIKVHNCGRKSVINPEIEAKIIAKIKKIQMRHYWNLSKNSICKLLKAVCQSGVKKEDIL